MDKVVNSALPGVGGRLRGLLATTIMGSVILLHPLATAPAQAQAAGARIAALSFNIPAQPLIPALVSFSEATGLQLFFDSALARDLKSPGVSGTVTPEAALRQLLAGSGMTYRFTNATTVTLERAAADGAMTLDPVSVEGAQPQQGNLTDPARTEGSHSYTAAATTIGKTPTAIKDIPQSVSVVTREMMDDRNVTDLAQAMKQTTGMTVVRYDGAGIFNEVRSRGYTIETTQLDGVATAQAGGSFATSFDAAIYDRMEVLRGPSGLYQSGGEPGGTINLARKRALDHWSLGGAASAGSWDAYRGEADVTGPLVESGKIRARVVGVFDDRQSYQDVVESNKQLAYGTVEADLSESTTVSVGVTKQEIDAVLNHGLTGYADGRLLDVDRSTFIGANWNNLDTNADEQFVEVQHRLDNGGTAQISGRHLDRWMLYEGARANGAVSNNGNVAYQTVVNEADREEWSFDGHVSTPIDVGGLTHTLLLGADYRTQQDDLAYGYGATGVFNVFSSGHNFGTSSIPYQFRTKTDIEQYGAYGQARIKPGIEWLTLVAGGRMSWWNTEARNELTNAVTARYSSRGEFTPYGGIVLDATRQVSVYASYSEIFKPQNAMDTRGNIIKPRVGGAYEAGVKGSFFDDTLNSHLAVYHMMDQNRAVGIPGCLGTNCNEAAGEVRSRGVEAQVSGSPLPQWDLSAGYAYVLTDIVEGTASTKGETFSPETPKHIANLWAKYTFSGGPLDALSLGGGVKKVSSFYSQSSGTRWVQDGYAVVDALAGYNINEKFDLSLNVNNVFDKKYYEKMSSGRQFYYGEPRSAMLTLRAKL